MRLLAHNALPSLTLSVALAIGCSGGAPADDSTDASGGMGGEASGGQGSGGDGSGGDGSGGEDTSSGGADTGGSSTGGDGSGGDESSGGSATGAASSGGQGGEGSGGDGSGGDGSGGSPGQCANGDTQAGTTPCGNNLSGTLVQSCEGGFWTDTAVCSGGDDCENDDERLVDDFCGLNGRGDIPQVCQDGVWTGSDCDDPDECEDGDDQITQDVCGLNARGDLAQVCVEGLWVDGDCDDPDECEDGDGLLTEDACGLNDRGDLLQLCVEGAWDDGDCDDPDECEDDMADTQDCLNGSGEQDLLCVEGAWEEDGECTLLTLYRASVSSAGVEGNGASRNPVLSADGRYVAFQSTASNLVAGDTNGAEDIFVHDVETGETQRVSLGSIAGQSSKFASISADGRYVAFDSAASDLIASDTNDSVDVFVRDLETNTTTRVSVTSAGAEVSGTSEKPRISADGRYVVFISYSSTLVPGDGNGFHDAFLHDRSTGTTTRLSATIAGVEANSYTDQVTISADGNVVALYGAASNLVSQDNNAVEDVFVRDLAQNTLVRASVSSDEVEGNFYSQYPALSADGRYVAFQSGSDNLAPEDTNHIFDIFVRDSVLGTTEVVSLSETGELGMYYSSQNPSLSADARVVAFGSRAPDLVAGDDDDLYDFFVRDRQAGTLRRFVGSLTSPINTNARCHVSPDGAYFAFSSQATTLVDGDTNDQQDIFIVPLD